MGLASGTNPSNAPRLGQTKRVGAFKTKDMAAGSYNSSIIKLTPTLKRIASERSVHFRFYEAVRCEQKLAVEEMKAWIYGTNQGWMG